MVALKSESRDQKRFPKYQLDQENCAPHTLRCPDTGLAGLGQEKYSTGTTSIRSLIFDVLLIVCFGLVILLIISVAIETAIWIYFNQECIFRICCNGKIQNLQSLDLRYWGTSMKEAENASIFFVFWECFCCREFEEFSYLQTAEH